MSFFILQEDGASHLLLEDGSGALLLDPPTSLDANFWLPTFPDRIPPLKYPHQQMWQEIAAVLVPVTIPIPDILHTQWFLPEFPERIVPRKTPRELIEPTSAALSNPGVINPLGWLPSFPDHPAPVHATPVRQGMTDATPSFNDVVTAGKLAWLPDLPDHPPPRRPPRQQEIAYEIFPPFIAATVLCAQLGLERVTSTTLTPDLVTTSDLVAEGLASTTLIAETLC